MKNYTIITRKDPKSVISEHYQKLRTSIDFCSFDTKIKVINVTSTIPKEGKTLTCLNLGNVYSQIGKKVLIIDMDLRKPKIHIAFNLSNIGGLTEYIKSGDNIKKEIINVDKNLDVLVSGEKVPFPSKILLSNKLNKMIEELKEIYDVIIIDCPPMNPVADPTIISNFCDGTIYVIASRKTNSNIAKHSLDELKLTGANILGGVLTRVQKCDASYGMYYDY